jgi:hypothetical protein
MVLFFYPPYDWGSWVNSVGWLYTFATEAIGLSSAKASDINQYIYNYEPWFGGSVIGLQGNDESVYDMYVDRKTRLNTFLYDDYPNLVDVNLAPYRFDIDHIQWALENVAEGGRVILQGDFSFMSGWESGGVAPTQSVEIVGEDAVIRGGHFVFLVGVFPHAPRMDVTIRDLTVEDYSAEGIFFTSGSFFSPDTGTFGDIVIHNVTMRGARASLAENKWGILVEGWQFPGAPPGRPPLIADNITITNCNIDIVGNGEGNPIVPYTVNDNWRRGLGIAIENGIGTLDHPVNIVVRGNTVKNTSLVGITVVNIVGNALVENNHILPGSVGLLSYGFDVGTVGIQSIQTLDVPWGGYGYPGEYARYTIAYNTIEKVPTTKADGSFDPSWTFAMNIDGTKSTVVRNNAITSAQDIDNGSFIDVQTVRDAIVKDNSFLGTGFLAIDMYDNSSNNHFIHNDLSELHTGLMSILLHGEGNSAKNNNIGPPGQWGGLGLRGSNNSAVNNIFHGDYPGWSEEFGPDGSPVEKGCVAFSSVSNNNMVTEIKLAGAPNGFDICGQVLDFGINNFVPGYEKCMVHSEHFIAEAQEKLENVATQHRTQGEPTEDTIKKAVWANAREGKRTHIYKLEDPWVQE